MKKILAPLAGIVAIALSVSFLWQNNWLLTLTLALIVAWQLYFWHQGNDLVYFFLALILGSALEIFCIYFGAWQYTNSAWLIPPWLPLGWALAGLNLRRLALVFENGGS